MLSELATLTLYNVGHSAAVEALASIRGADTFDILPVDEPTFAATCAQLAQYDDHDISFVDHLGGVLARQRDVERVFAFDDDFRTFGFTVVPDDTGEGQL